MTAVMGVMRAVAEWLGLAEPSSSREAADGVRPPSRGAAGGYVTVDQALTIGAVWRSVQIVTASIRQLDLATYRAGERIPDSPLIRKPDPDMSRGAFIAETVDSLATYGEAFWRVYFDGEGRATSLRCLPPADVGVDWRDRARTGRRFEYEGVTIPARNIRHLRLRHKPGALRGEGPIQAGRREIYGAFKLREFADGWFDLNQPIDGYLRSDQHLNETLAAQYAEAWRKFLKREGIGVLGAGLSYQQLAGKPAELQMLEVHRAQIITIARLFGISATDLLLELSGTSMTYQNVEQSNMSFLQKTGVFYMNEIEDHLTDLLPRGQHVQFLEEGLLRLDTISKWRVNKLKVDLGYTSGAELRRQDGLPPLPPSERPPRRTQPAAAPTGGSSDAD